MDARSANRSIPDLFTDIAHQVPRLLRTEAQLARTEMSEKIGQAASGLGMIVGGAVLLIPALVVLLFAAASAIADAGLLPAPWPDWAVGGGVLLLGLILLFIGMRRLRAERLVPDRTIAQLQRDARVATQLRSDHETVQRAA
jgi:protein-S-isoprenylcysteine O-methyltransferase Ste14